MEFNYTVANKNLSVFSYAEAHNTRAAQSSTTTEWFIHKVLAFLDLFVIPALFEKFVINCLADTPTEHVYTYENAPRLPAQEILKAISDSLANKKDNLPERAKTRLQVPKPDLDDEDKPLRALSLHEHAIHRIQKDLGRFDSPFIVKERGSLKGTEVSDDPSIAVPEDRTGRDKLAEEKYEKQILPLFDKNEKWADLCSLVVHQNLTQALHIFTEEELRFSMNLEPSKYEEGPAEVTILRNSKEAIEGLYVTKQITQEFATAGTEKVRVRKTLHTTVSLPPSGETQIQFDSMTIQHHVDTVS